MPYFSANSDAILIRWVTARALMSQDSPSFSSTISKSGCLGSDAMPVPVSSVQHQWNHVRLRTPKLAWMKGAWAPSTLSVTRPYSCCTVARSPIRQAWNIASLSEINSNTMSSWITHAWRIDWGYQSNLLYWLALCRALSVQRESGKFGNLFVP